MVADIRWLQRFANFEKALALLRTALRERDPSSLSDLESEGVAQRFEYTFELAWKTAKDFLEFNGVDVSLATPRAVLVAAIDARLLSDGPVWLDMLAERNVPSHTYDESRFRQALAAIRDRYLPALESLHATLSAKRTRRDG